MLIHRPSPRAGALLLARAVLVALLVGPAASQAQCPVTTLRCNGIDTSQDSCLFHPKPLRMNTRNRTCERIRCLLGKSVVK